MATVFVGGSALLLAGAMAALAFGFANGEETLVWTALVASAAAAVFLVVAYFISRREMKAAQRQAAVSEMVEDEGSAARTQPMPSQEAEVKIVEADPDTESTESTEGVDAISGRASGSPTATKPTTSKKPSSPGTAAAAKPSSPSDPVVAVVSKKKFHRPDCRYAKSEGAEEMTRAAARRRSFAPCGICKP
jgi:hypothetical protein